MSIAVHSITWDTFDQHGPPVVVSPDQILDPVNASPLPDGDIIWMSTDAGPGGQQIEVVLKTEPGITWFKEIKAFDKNRNAIGWISTQDHAHGPVSMTLPLPHADLLVFTKAKGLGVHTGMYAVGNLAAKAGRRLTFDWTKD